MARDQGSERQSHTAGRQAPRTPKGSPPVGALSSLAAGAGNAAFARTIARDAMGAGYLVAPDAEQQNFIKRAMIDVAKQAVDHPLQPMLCEQYGYGNGAPVTLTVEQMRQVPLMTPSGTMDVFVTSMPGVAAAMRRLWDELREAAGTGTSAQRSVEVTSGGTLPSRKPFGTFRCNLRGTLTGSSDGGLDENDAPRVTYEFDGAMTWYDEWDFDSTLRSRARAEVMREKWQGRPFGADVLTWIGSFLPGQPFEVHTPDVPIFQKQGESAQW